MGVDRSLTAIVGYVKVTLQTEQKKSDFKAEGDEAIVNIATPVLPKRLFSPYHYIITLFILFIGLLKSLPICIGSNGKNSFVIGR